MNCVERFVCREKEWKALNVIPVRMTDEDMDGEGLALELFQQTIAQFADACAGVEYDQMISLAQLNAGCIPAVAGGGLSWGRDGSPCSPESNGHHEAFLRLFIFSRTTVIKSGKSNGFTTYASAPSSAALSISGLYDLADMMMIAV
jgi:hypothetical protein